MKYQQSNIIKARQHFADIAMQIVADIDSGAMKPNNPVSYRQFWLKAALESITGQSDNSFTFWQMVHYFETGESVALLP